MGVKNKFTISKKVWLWPGEVMPWHFVYVDGKEKEYIKTHAIKSRNGLVKIEARIGRTSWNTSLLPFKKDDTYLIALKKEVRNKEGIMVGDIVKINFTLV